MYQRITNFKKNVDNITIIIAIIFQGISTEPLLFRVASFYISSSKLNIKLRLFRKEYSFKIMTLTNSIYIKYILFKFRS